MQILASEFKSYIMKEMFAKCISYDKEIRSRIGGNAPIVIEEQIPDNYKFYATIIHPEKENRMLSIIIHEDFEILISNNIYPPIEVKVIEHAYCEMGNNSNKSISDLGLNSISHYYSEREEDSFLFIKVGGEPRFIQHENYYYEKLESDNYSFFLQIDEEGYIDNMDYVFAFGGLYLYKHNDTGEIIAGFWQYS